MRIHLKWFTCTLVAMLCILCMAMPMQAWASLTLGNHDFGDGNGSVEAYPISSVDDLKEFSTMVNGGNNAINGYLTTDINMSGVTDFAPIGKSSINNPYSGKFDGCGYTISNLTINSSLAWTGLFGYVSGGLVENVALTGGSIKSPGKVGGIAGEFSGIMRNCRNENTVIGTNNVGGLCGTINQYFNGVDYVNSTIENCINAGKVEGIDGITGVPEKIGGLVGYWYGADLSMSLNTGAVTATSTGTVSEIGGIVGNKDANSTVGTCYYNKDFCTFGGINGADVANSATGLTTLQMTGTNAATNMAGFDFTNTWATKADVTNANGTKTLYYPQLKVFSDFAGVTSELPSVVVTTAEDVVNAYDGVISLREAIAYAGTGSLGSNITFDASVFATTQTITLDSTLTIDKDLTINGAGKVILDGGSVNNVGGVQIMSIASSKTVDLSNLTFQNGNAANGNVRHGGAISNAGKLTVTNSVFTGHRAQYGGAIYNKYGTLALMQVTFSGNSSSYGGAVHNGSYSMMKVDNSVFNGNNASSSGGAIFNEGILTVNNAVYSGNSASKGGAVNHAYYAGVLKVANSTFSSNSATTSGGAIYNGQPSYSNLVFKTYLVNSVFVGNTATTAVPDLFNADNSVLDAYSCFYGTAAGTIGGADNYAGLTTAIFADAANDDFTLTTSANPAAVYGVKTGADASGNVCYYNGTAWSTVSGDEVLGEVTEYTTDLAGNTRGVIPTVLDPYYSAGAYQALSIESEASSTNVTTTDDVVNPYDGLISFREAVENYSVAGNTITFTTGNGTLTVNNSVSVNKNITIGDGFNISTANADGKLFTVAAVTNLMLGNVTLGNGTIDGEGTLGIASSKTVTATDLAVNTTGFANSGTLNVSGNFTSHDTTHLGNVTYTGDDQTVQGGSYGTLTLSGDSDKNVADGTQVKAETLVVNSDVTFHAGDDLIVSQAITNDGAIKISGNFTYNGTATSFGTFTYDSGDDQTIAAGTYDDLTVWGRGTKTLAGDVTVTNQMIFGDSRLGDPELRTLDGNNHTLTVDADNFTAYNAFITNVIFANATIIDSWNDGENTNVVNGSGNTNLIIKLSGATFTASEIEYGETLKDNSTLTASYSLRGTNTTMTVTTDNTILYHVAYNGSQVIAQTQTMAVSAAGYAFDNTADHDVTFTVIPKELIVNWGSTSYTYNGTEQAVTPTVETGVGTETLDLAIDFGSGVIFKNAGDYTAYASTTNHDYKPINTSRNFTIAKKEITVSGIGASDKDYDGTTNVTWDYSGLSIQGIIGEETLVVSATGAFADANAGTGKTVNITNITLSDGTGLAANYMVKSDSQTSTTADIYQVKLTPPTKFVLDTVEIYYDETRQKNFAKATFTWDNVENNNGYWIDFGPDDVTDYVVLPGKDATQYAIPLLDPNVHYYFSIKTKGDGVNYINSKFSTPYIELTTPAVTLVASGSLNGFSTCAGSASASQSSTISGTNLPTDVVVTAPAGFEISKTENGTYGNSLTLTPTNNALASTEIWVRLAAATTAGSHEGNISIACGNSTKTLAIAGLVGEQPAQPDLQASSASICNGESTTLTAATGSDEYQWFIEGEVTPFGITTNNSIRVTPATATNYMVKAVNRNTLASIATECEATSSAVTVTVNQPTTGIDVQTACGSFIWIDGNTYTQSTSIPTYNLVNAAGCDSVVTLHLTIGSPATIANIVDPSAVCAGGSVALVAPSIADNGISITTEGWEIGGDGSWSAFDPTTAVAYADNGKSIRYAATNVCGTSYSNEVTLTVNGVPTISEIIAPSAVCAGGSVSLTVPAVAANGTSVVSEGWEFGGDGSWSAFDPTTALAFADNGKGIRYAATNGCGTSYSNEVALTVNDRPTVGTLAAPAAVCAGKTLALVEPDIDLNGSSQASAGWEIGDGAAWAAFDPATAVSDADNGRSIRYFATNGCGTSYSNEVAIAVTNLPSVGTLAAPSAVCSGSTIAPEAPSVADNGEAISAKGWEIGSGTSWAAFDLSAPVSSADNGKSIRYFAANSNGTAYSNEVTLTVNGVPTISEIIAPSAVCAGGSIAPTAPAVAANGTSVVSEGWELGGDGSWSAFDPTTALAFADNGKGIRYAATNGCGTSYSNEVALTVNDRPTIGMLPSSIEGYAGNAAGIASPSVAGNGSAITVEGWEIGSSLTWAPFDIATALSLEDNGKHLRYYAANNCGMSYSTEVAIVVSDKLEVADIVAPKEICSGSALSLTAPVVSNPSATGRWEISIDNGATWQEYLGAVLNEDYNGAQLRYAASNSKGDVYSNTVPITVNLHPSYLVQMWNDVLVCNNNKEIRFDSWQWYANGQPLSGETKQYYYANGTTLSTGLQVKAHTIDGKELMSCPLSGLKSLAEPSLRAYPNPTLAMQPFTVEVIGVVEEMLDNAKLTVYTTLGNAIYVQQHVALKNTLKLPQGIYIITVDVSGRRLSTKVVLQ